jgi:hypothetical protein
MQKIQVWGSWHSVKEKNSKPPPLQGEGTVAYPAYFDVVKHTLILAASCVLRLTECHEGLG